MSNAASIQGYWAEQLDLLRTLPAEVHARQPESIHDLRAAGRRLKATVRTYRPLIRRRLGRKVLRQLSWYNTVLGQARDAEVIADEVGELLGERPGGRAVIAALESERRRTAHLADNMLRSPAAEEVLASVAELVENPWRKSLLRKQQRPGPDQIDRRIRWAERRVAREWRLGPQGGEDDHTWRHRLRRRAKAARYAYESITAAQPAAAETARAYARVATLLGVLQDTIVIRQSLAVWPQVIVADLNAARDELDQQARAEVPQAILDAVPTEMIGDQPRMILD